MTGAHHVVRPARLMDLPGGPVEYRLEERGARAVLVLHGGHMRAGLALGEEVLAEDDCTILAPSRPGYGRTPLSTGTSADGFADTVAQLCLHLGIDRLAAVVGQSAGGPTAVTMAARHPALVQRLILQSAVSFLPWPGRATRLGGRVVFAPHAERATWRAMHTLVRRAPDTGLRLVMRGLTTKPIGPVVAALAPAHRSLLVELFGQMRSGSGFHNDLHQMNTTALHDGHGTSSTRRAAEQVTQTTLVVASPHDGAVGFAHAQALADAIPRARLITSRADSHMIWFGSDYPTIADTITGFLSQP
ncbi:alpha/beta hydrolase [Actinomadura darangshiensis]|uniref:Alpha/beta hydrolase n=1 Tax=Actinomadura darangshiensis TaxID=705336 RepID=A0A4R5BD08_9ACTN|nr:alpha/beta hydrolase [Actinomadura darangshiensis]TDD84398.1 alpha/beta hydrolase [Actinomadura darangshiensis]